MRRETWNNGILSTQVCIIWEEKRENEKEDENRRNENEQTTWRSQINTTHNTIYNRHKEIQFLKKLTFDSSLQ